MITLDYIHRYFQTPSQILPEPIIGNEGTRILSVLLWGVAGLNVVITGESGSAKTRISNATVSMIFGKKGLDMMNPMLYVIAKSSDKGQLTEEKARQIQQAYRCYIPELQNAKNLEDMLKLWAEGRPYKYTRAIKGGQDVQEFVLKPLPVLTNLAELNEEMPDLHNEMKRRFISLPTVSGVDINAKVHTMKADLRARPDEEFRVIDKEEKSELRKHLNSLVLSGSIMKVKNPLAPALQKVIPKFYTISNTIIDYFLSTVESITLFYHEHRPKSGKYHISLPGDNYVAHLLSADIMRNLSLGLTTHVAESLIEFIPLRATWGDIGEGGGSVGVTLDECVDFLFNEGHPRSKASVEDMLNRLVSANIIRVWEDKKSRRYYRTMDFNKFSGENIRWKEEIEKSFDFVKEHYPDVYEAYVDNAWVYICPYSGEEREIPKESVSIERKVGELNAN